MVIKRTQAVSDTCLRKRFIPLAVTDRNRYNAFLPGIKNGRLVKTVFNR